MPKRTLALPAPDEGWILCSDGSEAGRDAELRALAGVRPDVVIGLPASCVSTFLAELPPVEATLHESMIFAQIEMRGLAAKGGTLFDFESLQRREQSETFVVWVVTDLPEPMIVPTAEGYTTSAGLRNTTDGGSGYAALWREHGRLVLAVYAHGYPAHFQVLSARPEVGSALGKEINLLLLGLKGEKLFEENPPRELVLGVPHVAEKDLIELRSVLSIPVRPVGVAPVAADGEGRAGLLPEAVKRSRRKRRAAVRNIALLTAGLIAYAVVGFWIWNDARATREEIASLEHRISIIEPDVARVQLAEQRWRALEPAFDKNLFPVVQLSRITAALPGSGVVIREYRTTDRNIRIRGQARDVQLANRLLEDLEGMEGFEAYHWSLPNPKVEKNNTATFEIEGKLKNEVADS